MVTTMSFNHKCVCGHIWDCTWKHSNCVGTFANPLMSTECGTCQAKKGTYQTMNFTPHSVFWTKYFFDLRDSLIDGDYDVS